MRLCASLFRGAAAPLGCVILVRMLIALLVGSVANFPVLWYDKFNKSEFVERFPELSLFYRLFSPLNSEMICIFPYFCPYAESAREIRGIFVALHINNWFSEPILI